jgi:hypothetical protein
MGIKGNLENSVVIKYNLVLARESCHRYTKLVRLKNVN